MDILSLLSDPVGKLLGGITFGIGALAVAVARGFVQSLIGHMYRDRVTTWWDDHLSQWTQRDWLSDMLPRRNPYRKMAKNIIKNDRKGLL